MSEKRREQRPGDESLQEEDLLAGLYQQTKDEEPPLPLDAAILATARRAARPSSRRISFLLSRKWAVPLSLAAALWVTIEIVAMHLNEPRVAMKAAKTQSNSPAAPKPPAPSAELQSGGVPEESGRTRGLAFQALRKESSVANIEKHAAPMAVQPEAPPTSAGRPNAETLTAPVALDARLEGDKEDTSVETEAPPQLGKEQSVSATSAPGYASDAVEQKGPGRVDVVKDEIPSPEAWIAKIKELRRAGKSTEAEKSLKKFKERYPEYPVEKFLEQTASSPR